MNKELTPLEALEDLRQYLKGCNISSLYLDERFENVKAALEENERKLAAYEMFFNGFTYYFNGGKFTLTDLLNRIKAFEIIKNNIKVKFVGLWLGDWCIDIGQERYFLSKKDYELLKEGFGK